VDYENLVYDKPEDGIARITLNRPDALNALNVPLVQDIYAAAAEAAADDEVAVLIYRGNGRAFCAGRDFKYSGQLQTEDPEGWFAWRNFYRDFGPQTWMHPKATIAQVHGYALGGGHNIAVSCDITIASEDARFGYPEARYGILAGGIHVWNWMMGPKKTKEYMFTGRNFDASEAMMFGLINQVVPTEELEEAVLSMARDIVAIERRNPGYIRANKSQINYRHLELMTLTTLNPQRLADTPYETSYAGVSKESQEAFYTKVATEGFHAAVDDMHSGFTSST
jgi:enoyl-CoA hydratase/carnithine racemase